MKDLFLVVFFAETFLSASVAGCALFNYASRSLPTRLVGILFLVGALSNIAAYLFFILGVPGGGNLPATFYDFVLIVFAGLFYNNLTKSKHKAIFLSITIGFIILTSINVLFIQGLQVNSNGKLLGSFIIISYAVFYFYRMMIEMPTLYVTRLPVFWFNSALLLYHAGNVFLFAFTYYIINVVKIELPSFWLFHNMLSVIQDVLMLIGISYELKQVRASNLS
jgi:hypothetical protein